jgi:predicted transposase YdaD
MQIIDTRELPVEENIWLAGLDNRLDREMARKVLGEIYRSEQKAALTACFDVVYRKNIEAMEEASAMLDNIEAVLNTPLEKAGFVTRKMIQAATEAREENTKEIAQEALAKGIPIETVAEITKLDIKQVQALAGSR